MIQVVMHEITMLITWVAFGCVSGNESIARSNGYLDYKLKIIRNNPESPCACTYQSLPG